MATYTPSPDTRVEGDDEIYQTYLDEICGGRAPQVPTSALEGGLSWTMHWGIYETFHKAWLIAFEQGYAKGLDDGEVR